MKSTIFFFLALFTVTTYGQTVFSESFDEADDAITGSDAIGPTTWTTTCPGSIAATDYFKVNSGKLEARDTNSPAATWTTGDIDISSCTGLNISFTIEELSNMEECVDCGGTGAPCIDWVKLEYNLDGGGWAEVAGVTCALVESPGEMIQIGDILMGGPLDFTSPCIDFGSTLQLRISCKCWAGTEVWRFDNIVVACDDCILPVEIVDFKAVQNSNGIQINWTSINERSNDYFLLERSYDGIKYETVKKVDGAGSSSENRDYTVTDKKAKQGTVIYYRLTQFDFDGKSNFAEIISIESEPATKIYYSNNQLHYSVHGKQFQHLYIYNLNGQLVHEEIVSESGSIPWNKSGFFLIEIPETNHHQKLITP